MAPKTQYERRMADRLKEAGIGADSQVMIGRFVVDLWVPSRLVVVEVDGRGHDDRGAVAYDAVRDGAMLTWGIKVIRVRNADAETFDLGRISSLKVVSPWEYSAFRAAVRKANSGWTAIRSAKLAAIAAGSRDFLHEDVDLLRAEVACPVLHAFWPITNAIAKKMKTRTWQREAGWSWAAVVA